jgi:glutathione S-transferase
MGTTDLERAQVLGWSHKIFIQGLMAVAEMLRNQGDFFKNRALPGTLELEQIPALVKRGKLLLGNFFLMLEAHLQGKDYIVGDRLTLADIDALVACDFATWVKEAIPDHCPRLKGWYERVKVELN